MRLLFLTNLFPSAARPTFGVYHQQLFGAMAQHVEAQVVVKERDHRRRGRLRHASSILGRIVGSHGF